jgi:hypothetical protein
MDGRSWMDGKLELDVFWKIGSDYHIELHAPTNSTQKLKLIGKVGNSLILQHSPSRAGSPGPHTWNIGVGYNYFN